MGEFIFNFSKLHYETCFIYFESHNNIELNKAQKINSFIEQGVQEFDKINPIDLSMEKISQKMHENIFEIIKGYQNEKIIPNIGKDLNIFITNLTVSDRVTNYSLRDTKLNNLPNQQIAYTKDINIYLPIDIIVSEKILNGNKYENGDKRVPFIWFGESESAKKTSLAVILSHEIGHYYLNEIYPSKKLLDNISKLGCSNKKEIKEIKNWYRCLHESFAETWSIVATNYLRNNIKLKDNLTIIHGLSKERDTFKNTYDFSMIYEHLSSTMIDKSHMVWDSIELAFRNSEANFIQKPPYLKKIIGDFQEEFGVDLRGKEPFNQSHPFMNKNQVLDKINSIVGQQRNDKLPNAKNNFLQLSISNTFDKNS